jgi:retron-type reverse transcriptase
MSDQLLIDLFSAYFSARKNKRNTLSALEFEINYEKEIIKLHQELKNNSYQISKSFAFVVFDPVQREIIASSFRDRVIHHLIFNYINPLFEPLFIHDSYSCRKNKGTSYGIKRVEHFLKACSNNYQNNCYVLKLDLSGYFMSINLDILYYKIKEKILKNKNKCNFDIELILDLIKKIVFHDYTKKCCIKGNINDWRGLPKNKSLFYAQPKHGLPIGNLTSQLFSNIYLNEFDHFIKRKLKFKYYGRYVDDFIVIHKDKKFLKDASKIIQRYLEENLTLKINTKKIYLQECCKGFRFLGVIIKPFRVYINNRTKNNFYLKIREINNMVKNDEVSIKKDMILSSLNSYLGIMKHHNTYNLRKKTLTTKLHPNLFYFFEIDKNRKDCYLKLVKKY